MKAVLVTLLVTAMSRGQSIALQPAAEFDLSGGTKTHHRSQGSRSYFAATPNGLTLITVAGGTVRFTSADLDGRILHLRSDLASVHAQIHAALPCEDGSFWIVSSGPYNPENNFAFPAGAIGSALPNTSAIGHASTQATASYNELDRYNSAGEHLGSVRLLAQYSGWDSPVAARSNQLILRGSEFQHAGPAQSELVRFGTVNDNKFEEETQVRLAPPVRGALPVLASNGNLLLIDKVAGNMVVIDPQAKSGSVVQLPEPHSIQAATSDSGYLYLLSSGAVLKTDLAGRIVSSYSPQLTPGFEPTFLGVTGSSLYLVDRAGHTVRLTLPTAN